ncbi:MAG: 50S ribosomal protein L28 [Patescibacteria group bacterium]|jgi:ribosomal protein L28
MSRIDILTGKRGNRGNSRSHSNIATKRTQEVNLQTVRVGGVRVRISTRTIKTLKKLAAIATGQMPTKRMKKKLKTAARKQKQTA